MTKINHTWEIETASEITLLWKKEILTKAIKLRMAFYEKYPEAIPDEELYLDYVHLTADSVQKINNKLGLKVIGIPS